MSNLIKHILGTLRDSEGDKLFQMETITKTNTKGDTYTVEQPASLCSQFIMKCLSLLNTQVAKNWQRFDNFLDILSAFACGEDEIPAGNNVEIVKAEVSTKG
ncbi:MAG: hypothetical protein ACK56F_17125, partial [bacterium]